MFNFNKFDRTFITFIAVINMLGLPNFTIIIFLPQASNVDVLTCYDIIHQVSWWWPVTQCSLVPGQSVSVLQLSSATGQAWSQSRYRPGYIVFRAPVSVVTSVMCQVWSVTTGQCSIGNHAVKVAPSVLCHHSGDIMGAVSGGVVKFVTHVKSGQQKKCGGAHGKFFHSHYNISTVKGARHEWF